MRTREQVQADIDKIVDRDNVWNLLGEVLLDIRDLLISLQSPKIEVRQVEHD